MAVWGQNLHCAPFPTTGKEVLDLGVSDSHQRDSEGEGIKKNLWVMRFNCNFQEGPELKEGTQMIHAFSWGQTLRANILWGCKSLGNVNACRQ